MKTALLALLLPAFPQDTAEPFYKFKPGTTWTFKQKADGKEGKVVLTVTEEKEGKVYLQSKETREGEAEPRVETPVWYVENGLLVWADLRAETLKPTFYIYKPGSKKGDTWPAGPRDGEATHLGTAEVTVAAGTFKDVVQIRLARPRLGTVTFWLAPKVGMVKAERVPREGEEAKAVQLELAEFKEGK
jgi:hypothetical protein